jgi:periplasmic protein TonB
MLAYAASRPRIGARQSSPNAMLLVISAHIIVVALVLSTRMTMPPRTLNPPTTLISVPLPHPPLPQPVRTSRQKRTDAPFNQPQQPAFTLPNAIPTAAPVDMGNGDAGPVTIGEIAVPNLPPLQPQPVPATSAAQLLTPPSELKPPYPEAKLLTGEEATLTLRLSIDEHGRVIAADPVGRADPVFLDAARRHLLAHWRYRPAMKDGRAVGSTMVINLRFELDG